MPATGRVAALMIGAWCMAPAGLAQDEPTASVAGGFRIQLAAHGQQAGAEAAWRTLVDRHGDILGALAPVIEQVDRADADPLYRLQAGPLKIDAAKALCRALVARGEDCFVVPARGAPLTGVAAAPSDDTTTTTDPGTRAAAILAFNEGREAEAAALFRPLAEDGDPIAQNFMGLMHAHGRGLEKDLSAAVGWYRKSAENGFGAAQHNLADAYEHGDGVDADPNAAVKWYRAAAKQGIPSAQNAIASLYYRGAGVERSFEEAAHWYRKAADGNYAESQHNLAVLYFKGLGVPQDMAEAHFWWTLAAQNAEPGDAIAAEAAANAQRLEGYLPMETLMLSRARVAKWAEARR